MRHAAGVKKSPAFLRSAGLGPTGSARHHAWPAAYITAQTQQGKKPRQQAAPATQQAPAAITVLEVTNRARADTAFRKVLRIKTSSKIETLNDCKSTGLQALSGGRQMRSVGASATPAGWLVCGEAAVGPARHGPP